MTLSTFAMLLNYHHYLFPDFLLTTNRSSGSIEQERHHLFLDSLTPYSSSSLSVSCPPFLPPSSFSGVFVSVISFVQCLVGTFWILSLTLVSFYYILFFLKGKSQSILKIQWASTLRSLSWILWFNFFLISFHSPVLSEILFLCFALFLCFCFILFIIFHLAASMNSE